MNEQEIIESGLNNIKLSIIIPHFNSGKLLDKLLTSIVSECGGDTQIIVIDDNSTESLDDYSSCKMKYKGRVEFYLNQKVFNSAGACRNIGIDKAKGKWLLFCDADDYLVPGWYKTLVKYFDASEDAIFFFPIAVKIHSNEPSKRADAYRRILSDYLNGIKGADIRVRTKMVTPCSKLIKAQIIKDNAIKYDEIKYGNDVMFAVKLGLSLNSYAVSKDEIYCITEGIQSLTKDKTKETYMLRTDVVARRVKFVKERISYKEWLQSGIGCAPMSYVFNALARGYGFRYTKSIIKSFSKHGVRIFSIDSIMYQVFFHVFNI